MKRFVCLHDNPTNGQEFEPLLPLLKERGVEAVIHKRPINGSPLEPLLQSISATSKVSGGGPFGIIAYSWGAYLALAYLKRFPENVTGLILINPLLMPQEKETRAILTVPILRSLAYRWYRRSLTAAYLNQRAAPEPRPSLESFLAQGPVWRGEANYRELMKEKPLSADFSGIETPVRALFGKHDRIAPIDCQLPILKKLRRLHTFTLEAGHALPWTHPELVVEEVLRL